MKNCGNKNLCILSGAWDEIYVRNWECDTEMSDASVRPVQNKVIKQYVDEKFKEIAIGGVEQYAELGNIFIMQRIRNRRLFGMNRS